jgi:hypothetical protein
MSSSTSSSDIYAKRSGCKTRYVFAEVQSPSEYVYLFRFCTNFDVTIGMQDHSKQLMLPDEFKQQHSGFNAIMNPTAIHVWTYDSYLN